VSSVSLSWASNHCTYETPVGLASMIMRSRVAVSQKSASVTMSQKVFQPRQRIDRGAPSPLDKGATTGM
jgi:hypothetical protein